MLRKNKKKLGNSVKYLKKKLNNLFYTWKNNYLLVKKTKYMPFKTLQNNNRKIPIMI